MNPLVLSCFRSTALRVLVGVLLMGITGHVRPAAAQIAEELDVCAAASLTDAVTDIARVFKSRYGTAVRLNLAGSNTLRIQIEKGAPCDVFLSADEENVQQLVGQGLIDAQDTQAFLRNQLVVVVSAQAEGALHDLADLEHMAGYLSLADPQTVPAGIYAKQALQAAGLWPALQGRIAPALDVRAALAQVEQGVTPGGIVYATDAAAAKNVTIAFVIPADFQPDIVYVAGVLRSSPRRWTAQEFLGFLTSEQGRTVLKQNGFTPL